MKKSKFDIAIVGAGVAGCFAALRAVEKFGTDAKIIIFDIGKEFGKRRRQLEGALGVFPNSDGKLYLRDLDSLRDLGFDGRSLNAGIKWVDKQLESSGPLKLISDRGPNISAQSKINSIGCDYLTNDYYQWKPEYVHKFSKFIVSIFEQHPNVIFSFENEVNKILKKKGNEFLISSDNGDFIAKNVVLAVGRTGFRWVNDFYKEMGMEISDDIAKFGVRFEIGSQYLKDFQGSSLQLIKRDNSYSTAPFCWNGTVIPVDHANMVCSGFRSNEDRWESKKVSFGLIGHRSFPGKGVAEVERMACLTYLLYNDRVAKEKVKSFVKGGTQLNLIKEYDWLSGVIKEMGELIPNIISNGFYHTPYISCEPGKISIDSSLETEISGLYVAGEAGRIRGIYGAAVSGTSVIDSIAKK